MKKIILTLSLFCFINCSLINCTETPAIEILESEETIQSGPFAYYP